MGSGWFLAKVSECRPTKIESGKKKIPKIGPAFLYRLFLTFREFLCTFVEKKKYDTYQCGCVMADKKKELILGCLQE